MLKRSIQILLVFSVLFTIRLISNPLPIPTAIISEFTFDKNGQWVLEISFRYSTAYRIQDFDSICVGTSNGISRIILDHLQNGAVYFVITSDSLDKPLAVKNEGDCLKLYSYITMMSYVIVDSLSFGNYPGSLIGRLTDGCSISRLNYMVFCKDRSPTIGTPNDTAGTIGYLEGFLFDKNEKMVTEGIFRLDNLFMFSENGTFRTSIFSRKISCAHIERSIDQVAFKYEKIDSLQFSIEPDSIIEINIHCKDYIVSVASTMDHPNTKFTMLNYPNPFNSSTNFLVNLPSDLDDKMGFINIFSVTGELVYSIPISNTSTVTWNGKNQNGETAASGVYYYQLMLDNTVYKNGSMILLH